MKSLKQQLRKSREEVLTSHKKIGELQDDVRKLSTTNQRLEAVAGKKSLLERDQLTVQVQLLSGKLAERQKRVLVGLPRPLYPLIQIISRNWRED